MELFLLQALPTPVSMRFLLINRHVINLKTLNEIVYSFLNEFFKIQSAFYSYCTSELALLTETH